ncbi:MAG: hypothetical protein HY716_02620 [Planctomycetes bacterium]|nr:hypothetical protein [Planctomycetota bacterium]
MNPTNFPWKRVFARILKCTLLLYPMGYFILLKPDWYECPQCGRKKVVF